MSRTLAVKSRICGNATNKLVLAKPFVIRSLSCRPFKQGFCNRALESAALEF